MTRAPGNFEGARGSHRETSAKGSMGKVAAGAEGNYGTEGPTGRVTLGTGNPQESSVMIRISVESDHFGCHQIAEVSAEKIPTTPVSTQARQCYEAVSPSFMFGFCYWHLVEISLLSPLAYWCAGGWLGAIRAAMDRPGIDAQASAY